MDYSKLVSQVDLIKQPKVDTGIGSLDAGAISSLLAQQAKSFGGTAASLVGGKVGSFGIDSSILEKQGFLKPGLLSRAAGDTSKINSLLNDPAAWTGKGGVSSLGDVLGDQQLQTKIQAQSLSDNFTKLKSLGIVSGTESPAQLAGLLNGSSVVGLDKIKDLANGINIGDATNQLKTAIDSAKLSNALNDKLGKLPKFGGGSEKLAAVNTVNRAAADQMLQKILNDPKIPIPGDLSPGLGQISETLSAKLNSAVGLKLPSLGSLPTLDSVTGNLNNALGSITEQQRMQFSQDLAQAQSTIAAAGPATKTFVSGASSRASELTRLLGKK